MSTETGLPSGPEPVCPRCGTAQQEDMWCSGCGLNLRQQGELPSGDAYAAKAREERWLEEQRKQQGARREQEARERAAEREREGRERERRAAEASLARQAAAEEKAEKKRQRQASKTAGSKRSWLIAGGVFLLLLLAGGVGAYALLLSPDRQTGEPTVASEPTEPEGEEMDRPTAAPEKNDSCGTTRFSGKSLSVEILRGTTCEEAMRVLGIYDREFQAPSPWQCFLARQGQPNALACGYGSQGGDIKQAPHAFIGKKFTVAAGKEEEPLSESSPLSTEGLGPVIVGTTVEEAEMAAQTALVDESEGPAPSSDCRYVQPEGLRGVAFMVTNGEIARVDVKTPEVATLSGVTIGDQESDVLAEYGDQISSKPSEVNPSYNTLTFTPADPSDKTRMVFVSTGSKVVSITAGRLPEVEYPEGCF